MDSFRCFIAADRRAQFEKLEYTEDDYQKELEHIEQVTIYLSLHGLCSCSLLKTHINV